MNARRYGSCSAGTRQYPAYPLVLPIGLTECTRRVFPLHHHLVPSLPSERIEEERELCVGRDVSSDRTEYKKQRTIVTQKKHFADRDAEHSDRSRLRQETQRRIQDIVETLRVQSLQIDYFEYVFEG